LRYWYGAKGTSECEKIKKSSQQVGQGVHKAIEKFLRGIPFDECKKELDEQQYVMFSNLVKWCRQVKLKAIAMEEPLYWYCKKHHPKKHTVIGCQQDCTLDCTEFNLAGTPDAVCTFNGGKSLTVVDWKTDSVPSDTAQERERAIKYYWQNTSYAMMYNRQFGTKINKALTVRSVTPEKVKDGTQNKLNLVLPNYVKVKYSDDYTFATYSFPDLKEGVKDVKLLRHLYRQVRGK
jgi:ATP-dependent exoDNAse (exonuclease V) beta subunit